MNVDRVKKNHKKVIKKYEGAKMEEKKKKDR